MDDLIIIPDEEMMLTTMDNPYNPKEDYDKWRNWDILHGYNTESLLDRIANVPPDEEDEVTISEMVVEAMLSILETPEFGPYKIV